MFKAPTLKERFTGRLYKILFNLIGIKYGPYMMRTYKYNYIFIDPYGTIWDIRPTGQRDIPVNISRIYQD